MPYVNTVKFLNHKYREYSSLYKLKDTSSHYCRLRSISNLFLAIEVGEVGVLQGLFCAYSVLRILLETFADQVNQLGVLLNPILLKVGYAIGEHRHIQVLDLLWLVANGHFIEDNSKCPHVN